MRLIRGVGSVEKGVHEILSSKSTIVFIESVGVGIASEKHGGGAEGEGGIFGAIPPRAARGQGRDDCHENG